MIIIFLENVRKIILDYCKKHIKLLTGSLVMSRDKYARNDMIKTLYLHKILKNCTIPGCDVDNLFPLTCAAVADVAANSMIARHMYFYSCHA